MYIWLVVKWIQDNWIYLSKILDESTTLNENWRIEKSKIEISENFYKKNETMIIGGGGKDERNEKRRTQINLEIDEKRERKKSAGKRDERFNS